MTKLKKKPKKGTSKPEVVSLKKHKKSKKDDRKQKAVNATEKSKAKSSKSKESDFNIPVSLMEKSKTMAPMTKEQWEKQQSVVRRVYDETTGRSRY